ncbi:MAG: hypothetical protein ACRESR_01210 [Gammaproteobacteria bacterium]
MTMVERHSSPGPVRAGRLTPRGAIDVWLAAVTYWYLSALMMGLAFSFGFCLVRPGSPNNAQKRSWLGALNWEDGGWYSQIAADGYKYRPGVRSNVAFFPAYPLLGRALTAAAGVRAEAALLLVSNLSLLAALAMIAFYVRDRYRDGRGDLADYALLATAFFPTGCFFRLAYSESTFLLVAVLAMYAMLRRWPLCAIALVVGSATATRAVGVALLAPFAIHIWRRTLAAHQPDASARKPAAQPHREAPASDEAAGAGARPGGPRPWRWFPGRRFGLTCARLVLYLPLACWGLGLFVVYQHRAFGDPIAFVKAQKKWGALSEGREKAVALATLKPIWSVYDPQSRAHWTERDQHCIPWLSLHFANPVLFVSAAALVSLGACRRLPRRPGGDVTIALSVGEQGEERCSRWLSPEETSLSVLLLLIPYVTRAYEMNMGSMGRFTAVVFPMYLVLGRLLVAVPAPLRAALLALSGVFLWICTALYAARYAIY